MRASTGSLKSLIKDARKMLTEEAGIRRVSRIVGGASMEEMLKYWNYFSRS